MVARLAVVVAGRDKNTPFGRNGGISDGIRYDVFTPAEPADRGVLMTKALHDRMAAAVTKLLNIMI